MRIASFLILCITMASLRTAAGSAYSVEEWDLGVVISGNVDNFAGAVFLDVMDPFVDSHAVALSNSSASAAYSFWLEQGSFLIEADLAADAEDNSSLLSAASGDIVITPSMDLVIQYASVYDVTLPAHSMTSQLNLNVIDVPANEFILQETRIADTVFGVGPRHFELSGEFVMPAGRTWVMKYSFDILAYASSSGNLGFGSGFVEYRIIPESSTLLLAVPLALLFARRRKRRAA